MAKFIELISDKSGRPVSVNIDSIAWVSTREVSNKALVTVIHFTAGLVGDAVSLTVKEEYNAVIKMIAA